ncbi:MAG: preprotein translocase subunit SecD [Methanotrichaceae archaeon]|nr:preprotein translocase subunit SecD [Methanotrichaceae archaeon]
MKDEILKDKRVLLWIGLVALSLILIAVHPTTEGFASGLKYGLDLQGGSWLQLQLKGAMVELDVQPEKILQKQFNASSVEKRGDSYIITVNGEIPATLADDLGYSGAKSLQRDNVTRITIMTSADSVISNYLKKELDADVKIVSMAPVVYEIRTNVTRESLNELLAPVGGSVVSGKEGFVEGVKPETVDETKKVLDSKLNRLGLQDIKVRTVGNQFILIDLAGVDITSAQDLVGKPGKFEIRIQTEGNETMHVLYGDAVDSVEIPRGDSQSRWGVPFALSEEGARIFQKAAIDAGATKDPEAHEISMYLDKDEIFSAPLAPELAASLQKSPSRSMVAEAGMGDEGSNKAKELYIHLREGALPVSVMIVSSGQMAALLGKQFKFQMVVGGVIAILIVAGLVYRKYRERRIVLPMVTTSFSEVILILGVWALMGWQLDLASIAGIILVIGTGVDHLIIITDELIQGGGEVTATSIREKAAAAAEKAGGKVAGPSGKVYMARLARSFSIILAAAATTVAAMFPMLLMGFGALTGFALSIIIGVLIGVGVARPAYGRVIGYILAE